MLIIGSVIDMNGEGNRLVALHRALGKRRVYQNFLLAPFTTLRIGGRADLYYEAYTSDELAAAIRVARQLDIPFFVLGLGANIVFGDLGFRGLVIRNCAASITLDLPNNRIHADSGAKVYPDLIMLAVSNGLSGLEHYVGIPSTVGGAMWQNLHFLSPDRSRTMFIEEVVRGARILTEDGSIQRVPAEYFEFGYDYSILHTNDDIVLSTTFQLVPADVTRMLAVIDSNIKWRILRHPPLRREPSVGSIYKKIDGVGAGRLIDECGLKGATIGGMTVSHRHANILVNTGAGRAADLQGLMVWIERTVKERTGYQLDSEIEFVGEFDKPAMEEPTFIRRPLGLISAADHARAAIANART